MSEQKKANRPKARVAKGFRDVGPEEIRGIRRMLATIQEVYESYGFEPVEQPLIEYTEALGKFLPDQDRPNAGVFSFQDDDGQWLSLRYDLTAPLARYVAENQQSLPTPYRSYRQGWVFRNEKPGPGRFRQFMQFDADTVGTSSPAADAEVCMMAADTMEALGMERGQYVLKYNNRKILDGVFDALEVESEKRLTALRALDKFDRLGQRGVEELLTVGRKDESGDFTKGAGLSSKQADRLLLLLGSTATLSMIPEGDHDADKTLVSPDTDPGGRTVFPSSFGRMETLREHFGSNELARQGFAEVEEMHRLIDCSGYGFDRIRFDPSVVRGLEYYTGPVFECELLMETKDEEGRPVRFGSVGGGGRYDDLVARFTGQKVPATGFSIGVSRLYSALKLVGKAQPTDESAPVVVLVLDRERQADYWRMVQELRNAGVRAEMYVGTAGMKAQMKYGDKRGAPLVVIQGSDEKARGEVQIKDLRLGSELASHIATREEYAAQRLAQVSVKQAEFVAQVRKMLGK